MLYKNKKRLKGGNMRQFIFASLVCFSFTHLHGVNPPAPNEPPPPKDEEQGEIAGPENAYDYNLYDREQNRRDQQQRQQYFYYQSQDQNQNQNQNAPQYTRKKQPLRSQYFDPRNE
jgi:hypothetical protein